MSQVVAVPQEKRIREQLHQGQQKPARLDVEISMLPQTSLSRVMPLDVEVSILPQISLIFPTPGPTLHLGQYYATCRLIPLDVEISMNQCIQYWTLEFQCYPGPAPFIVAVSYMDVEISMLHHGPAIQSNASGYCNCYLSPACHAPGR